MARSVRTRWGPALVALAMVLVACGGDDDEGRVETDDPPEAGALAVFHYEGTVDEDDLVAAVKMRLSALDVSGLVIEVVEPDTVTVELEGPDQATLDAAIDAVQQQGELRFRPVLSAIPGSTADAPDLPPGFVPTPRELDTPEQPVTLTEQDADGTVRSTYQLGPTAVTGEIVESADAELNQMGQWEIRLVITEDAIDEFNALASTCFAGGPICPTSQVAIVLDSVVMSAPTISQPSFERDQIVISGSFTQAEARTLAVVLDTGTLPVRLELESVAAVGR